MQYGHQQFSLGFLLTFELRGCCQQASPLLEIGEQLNFEKGLFLEVRSSNTSIRGAQDIQEKTSIPPLDVESPCEN